jgi:anti-sigma factor RsiW
VSAGGRRFSVQVPDWGQDHLSAEAVAAYVDGELGDRPYDRATRHLAECAECAAQVVAQGQARAALRSARCPSLPSSLITSLRSIPQAADLPPAPNGLAVTRDGQFVATLAPSREDGRPRPSRSDMARSDMVRSDMARSDMEGAPAGLAEPPTPNKGRLGRFGAGAAMSGLALGALAIGAAIIAGDAPSSPAASPVGGPVVVDAHLQLPGAP